MSALEIERRGSVLLAIIARQERANSLSRDTLRAFAQLQQTLAGSADVRALVITGKGDRAFCAGADLKERATMNAEQVREQLIAYRTELGWLDECSVPVIAAINGAALGGGLELALLCDLRVAAAHATFALPETSLGIIPAAGGTQRLPRLIGEARALEMILLGTRLDAARAQQWGLIHRIVAAEDDLIEQTLEWIAPIVNGAPIAQAAALRAIRASRGPLEQGLQAELEAYERCLASEDRVEALEAFAQKRKPQFSGR